MKDKVDNSEILVPDKERQAPDPPNNVTNHWTWFVFNFDCGTMFKIG